MYGTGIADLDSVERAAICEIWTRRAQLMVNPGLGSFSGGKKWVVDFE